MVIWPQGITVESCNHLLPLQRSDKSTDFDIVGYSKPQNLLHFILTRGNIILVFDFSAASSVPKIVPFVLTDTF